MKQLDIEQAEEMPSSTLTSTEGITPCHNALMLPPRLQISSDTTIEGEIVTETDMPPLTGTTALTFSHNLLILGMNISKDSLCVSAVLLHTKHVNGIIWTVTVYELHKAKNHPAL